MPILSLLRCDEKSLSPDLGTTYRDHDDSAKLLCFRAPGFLVSAHKLVIDVSVMHCAQSIAPTGFV